MYKRYITRNGARMGPYYYHSVKTEDGRVLSVYLGNTEEKANGKLGELRLDMDNVKKRQDTRVASLREAIEQKQANPEVKEESIEEDALLN